MAWNKLPFVIVIIATILPWIAAFFDAKWITYVPLCLALLTYFVYETRKHSKVMSISYGFLVIFFVISISVFWQLIQGIGIGSGGTIIILVLTFIYYKLFTSTQFGIPSKYLIKQIHIIYMIHVIFILSELFFRLAGGTDIIVSLVGNATEVSKYKMYNKAVFLRFIGFKNMTGLGGLLLGSQSASQVALFALFIFAPFYKTNVFYKYNKIAHIWFVLAVIALLISITMTASIISVIFLFIIFFYLPNSKYKNIKYQSAFIIISIIFFIPFGKIFLFNITSEYAYLTYFTTFYASVDNFIKLDLITKIFGLGRSADSLMITTLSIPGSMADFGYGMLLNQSGILLIGFASFLLVNIFIKTQHSIRKIIKLNIRQDSWMWLASVNSLIALGWGLSLIHYTPALELGGRELFAFHLAVCLQAMKYMNREIALGTRYPNG